MDCDGSGERTYFWKDSYLNGCTAKFLWFPLKFSRERVKSAVQLKKKIDEIYSYFPFSDIDFCIGNADLWLAFVKGQGGKNDLIELLLLLVLLFECWWHQFSSVVYHVREHIYHCWSPDSLLMICVICRARAARTFRHMQKTLIFLFLFSFYLIETNKYNLISPPDNVRDVWPSHQRTVLILREIREKKWRRKMVHQTKCVIGMNFYLLWCVVWMPAECLISLSLFTLQRKQFRSPISN